MAGWGFLGQEGLGPKQQQQQQSGGEEEGGTGWALPARQVFEMRSGINLLATIQINICLIKKYLSYFGRCLI